MLSDWLWFDEKDQVNILAHLAPTKGHEEGGFLVFRTRKYGLQGQRYGLSTKRRQTIAQTEIWHNI